MKRKAPKYDASKATDYTPGARKAPKYDASKATDYTPQEEEGFLGKAADFGMDVLETIEPVLTTMDIPGAAMRSTVHGGMEGLGNYASDLANNGLDAVRQAVTGRDVLQGHGLQDEGDDSWLGAAAGFGAELAMDPFLVSGLGRKALGITGKSLSQKAGEGISKIIKKKTNNYVTHNTAKALAEVKPLTEGNIKNLHWDTEEMASKLVEEDLAKYINNPIKILEKLTGKAPKKSTSGGLVVNTKMSNKGLIDTISDDVTDTIIELSGNRNTSSTYREIIVPEMKKYIGKNRIKAGAKRHSPTELRSFYRKLNEHINYDDYTLMDMHQLKKSLNEELKSEVFMQTADKAISNEKEAILGLTRRLKDLIDQKLSIHQVDVDGNLQNAAKYYADQNKRMHHLITIKDRLITLPEKELRKADMGQMMANMFGQGLAGGIAGAGAELLGLPHGMEMGAALGAVRSGGNSLGRKFSSGMPGARVGAASALPEAAGMAAQAVPRAGMMKSREIPPERPMMTGQGREPNSVNNLPLQLSTMKLPRTVEGLMQNKELVKAKVAQQAPAHSEHINFILDERPEDIEQILPMFMKMIPQAFEHDKYGRMNGMVIDPALKNKARKDIMEDDELSNGQKIKLINKMNRTGELKDY